MYRDLQIDGCLSGKEGPIELLHLTPSRPRNGARAADAAMSLQKQTIYQCLGVSHSHPEGHKTAGTKPEVDTARSS